MNFATFQSYVADFGDSAVLIGLVFTTAFYLLWCKKHGEALALVASLLIASSLIAALKLALISCGHGIFNIKSPSGHSAMSIAVFGTFGLILSGYFNKWRRFIPIIFFFALGFFIALSRILTKVHTISDVIIGTIVGLSTIALIHFVFLKRRSFSLPSGKFNVFILIGLIIAVAIVLHGYRLPAELFIQNTAGKIKHSFAFCS